MIGKYKLLRQFCHENDWAAGFSAALLVLLLGSMILFTLEYHGAIRIWLDSNTLVNGLIVSFAGVVLSMFMMLLLSLSFCPCSLQDRTEKADYRTRPVLCGLLKGIRNLGINPKRKHKPVRGVSA